MKTNKMEKEFFIFGFGRPDNSPALIVNFSALEGADYERAYEHAYDFCPFGGAPGYSTGRYASLEAALHDCAEYRLYEANPEGEPIEVSIGSVELSAAAAALGRKGGASKSEAKVKAARDNGKKGGRPRDNKSPRCHDDGTVSYWSVYRQSFVSRAACISDEDLAAMNAGDRGRVIAHIAPGRE